MNTPMEVVEMARIKASKKARARKEEEVEDSHGATAHDPSRRTCPQCLKGKMVKMETSEGRYQYVCHLCHHKTPPLSEDTREDVV